MDVHRTSRVDIRRYDAGVRGYRQRWAGVAAAVVAALGVPGCGGDEAKPEAVMPVRDMTEPCEFLNNSERATLQLDPAYRGSSPSPTPTALAYTSLCIFFATEPYNRNRDEYVYSVTVVLLDTYLEVARTALDNSGKGTIFSPDRLRPYAQVPDKPYYQREGTRTSHLTCDRLLARGPTRSIEVSVALENVSGGITAPTPCQVTDRIAPLIEQKLVA
jgi:hypothetical protein